VKFFDTSVLVAVVTVHHVHHARSLKAYLAARKQGACAAHSLAEVYSTLTRLPGNQRMECDQAMLVVEDILQRLHVVELTAEDYYEAITGAVADGITGGIFYDALIARCALKVKADAIYTWNARHFQQLGSAIAKLVRTP
jgi:predicted nucleic acid-binding protein